MRKIVQLSVAGVANTSQTQCDWITTALCNDGTAWIAFGHHSWQFMGDIPQEGYEPDETKDKP